MKLLYRTGVVSSGSGLGLSPSQYGFDTLQGSLKHTSTKSSIDGEISNWDSEYGELDFVLNIHIDYDPLWNAQNFDASSPVNREVKREWYDNPSAPWYTFITDRLQEISYDTNLKNRFRGLRWNHEYPPVIFDQTGFLTWAIANNCPGATYVSNNLGEWDLLMAGLKGGSINSHILFVTPAQINTPQISSETKSLYPCLVDYQTTIQMRVVEHLADILAGFGWKIFLYPCSHQPISYAREEYCVDWTKVSSSKTNVIYELGTWDHANQSIVSFLEDISGEFSNDGRPYYFTMQQGIEWYDRLNDVEISAERRLGIGNPNISPWENSIGFWTGWTKYNPSADPPQVDRDAEQQQYMDALKAALT